MDTNHQRILVILNPASGVVSKDQATSYIFKKLRRHFETVSIINTVSPSHAQEITRQALDNFDIITAFGGDGTINSIASVLIHSNKTLGILPGGSGNGLARNIHLPLSWRRALETLIKGRDVLIDAGKINDTFFFNTAGIGLDGMISKKFNQEAKARGIIPYVYLTFKGFIEMPIYKIEITISDLQFEEDVLLAAFANFRQYGGRAIIAPFASPYDRHLDLCLLKKFQLLKSSLSIQRLFTGQIQKFPFYKSIPFEQIHIRSLSGPIPFHYDGEYSGPDVCEFDVCVLPASLKIRIPLQKRAPAKKKK